MLLGVAIGLGAAFIRPSLPGPSGLILSGLPGEPMDLEVVDGAGYATLFDGRIVKVVVESGHLVAAYGASGVYFFPDR